MSEVQVFDGGGGASFSARIGNDLLLYSVSRPAPDAVRRASARLVAEMNALAQR